MKNFKRLVPLLVVFAITGSLAMGLLHKYLEQERAKLRKEWQRLAENYKNPIDVVVAAKDLPLGTTLEAAQLTMAQIPDRFVQPYSTANPQALVGLVTLAPIAQGEQVLLNKVRRQEDVPAGSILSSLMPKGKRAITIGVDSISGVGGFVRPGDKVDILWTLKVPAAGGEGQVVTVTLFQDVPVLAVGRELIGRGRQVAETASEYTVTLALTPQETSFLLFAREQGRLQLSLRSHLDSGAQPIAPANITSLLESQVGGLGSAAPGQTPAPHAAGSGPPTAKVEIYRGLQRDVVELAESGGSPLASSP